MKATILAGLGPLMLVVVAGCSQPDTGNGTTQPESVATAPATDKLAEPPEHEDIHIPEIIPEGKGELHGLSVTDGGETLALDEGLVLVAVLNASCEHCAASVPQLNELMTAIEDVPLAGLVLGSEKEVEAFKDTNGALFPLLPTSADVFFSLITSQPPRLVLAREGRIATGWDWEDAADFPSLELIRIALKAIHTPPPVQLR